MSEDTFLPVVVAILLFHEALVLAPFFVATYLAVFRGRGQPRRALFVFVATSLTYGVALFGYVLAVLPFALFVDYLLPELRNRGHFPEFPFWLVLFDQFYTWQRTIYSIVILVLALVLVRWLWRRWPRIAVAVA